MISIVTRARPFYRAAPGLLVVGWVLCLLLALNTSSAKFVVLGYMVVFGFPLAVPALRREIFATRKYGVVSVSESTLYLWERRGYVGATRHSLETIDAAKLRLEFDEHGYLTLFGAAADAIRLRYWSLHNVGVAEEMTLNLREQVVLRQH